MALPIKELITLDLLGALNGVQTDAGFNTDLDAERVDELSNTPGDSKAVLYEGDERPEDEPSLGHDGYFQPYTIRAWATEPEEAGETIESRLGTIGKDIVRAVMLDPHRHNRAHWTNVVGVKTYPQNEPPAVDVQVEVFYRTLFGDPFNQ